MSSTAPRLNNFMKVKRKYNIDTVTKIFIIIELLLGVNRLLVLDFTKKIYSWIILGYTLGLNILFFYVSMQEYYSICYFYIIVLADFIQFFICSVLAFVLQARFKKFYLELNQFDEDIGCKSEATNNRKCIQNCLLMLVTILLSIAFYIICNGIETTTTVIVLLIMKLLHCLELHYYGHLFILIIPRIKLITNYIRFYHNCNNCEDEESNCDQEFQIFKNQTKQFKRIEIQKLIIFYNRIIVTFDSLYESIKWQMLIIIIATFIISLDLAFHIVKIIIIGEHKEELYSVNLSFSLMELLPLLVPCLYAEQVCDEVRLLKDHLTSRLYENSLDKSNRSSARSLLALIETRNLSFSVFHMFDIDIALPFKFLALLLTYLIILLQFEKVIHP